MTIIDRRGLLVLVSAATGLVILGGCSATAQKQTKVFNSGEKVQVARLTYAVIDVQIHPTLPGPDPAAAEPRIPQNRFYVVQISVSNGGNEDTPIPGLALVDDSGHVYNELPDGSGVPRWMGMVRRVQPGQTEEGNLVFDAPTAHYKLRFTDETDDEQIYSDIPLNFVHEVGTGGAAADLPLTPDAVPPSKK